MGLRRRWLSRIYRPFGGGAGSFQRHHKNPMQERCSAARVSHIALPVLRGPALVAELVARDAESTISMIQARIAETGASAAAKDIKDGAGRGVACAAQPKEDGDGRKAGGDGVQDERGGEARGS